MRNGNAGRISFDTLGRLVHSTKGKKLPTARALRGGDVPVVARAVVADGSLTVYESGFYTYSTSVGTTVFAVDRCEGYAYDGGSALEVDQFRHEDWTVRLLLAGEDRLEHNNNACEQGTHFSYSDDAVERSDLRDPYDFMADLENHELVERMLGCLTDKQREVIRLYFFEGLTQQKIQEKLALSRGALLDRLDAAIKKMKKVSG